MYIQEKTNTPQERAIGTMTIKYSAYKSVLATLEYTAKMAELFEYSENDLTNLVIFACRDSSYEFNRSSLAIIDYSLTEVYSLFDYKRREEIRKNHHFDYFLTVREFKNLIAEKSLGEILSSLNFTRGYM